MSNAAVTIQTQKPRVDNKPYGDWSICSTFETQEAAGMIRAAINSLQRLTEEQLRGREGVRLEVRRRTSKLGQPAELVRCGTIRAVEPADDGYCMIVQTADAGPVRIRVRYVDDFAGARPGRGYVGSRSGVDWSLQ